MAIQKKSAKGRLDKWYKLAKEKGYRARAAFKLIQLNKKYHVLEKSKVLLDLCAAPGSWCQVASEVMPKDSIIVGVDLAPIKPIPRCILFQSDITTDKCRATIRQHLKTWKADVVLHDGAPNVGTAWVQDAFSQAELVLQSLKLATEFLAPGGSFITKVFRSKDYNALLWVFKQLFDKVEATKPPSSRNVSAEIFVVCRGYKAPKKIDPRFLDPKSVFEELTDPTPNNEAKVFNPEKKKRKREGYEEGNYTQFKEVPAFEFIETNDPIAMLGTLSRLSFEQAPNGDVALAALVRMPETTKEIRDCCEDLRVLGRKEFKLLLRWRLKMRDKFELSSKSKVTEAAAGEEVAEVESMDEEMQIQEDLQREKDQQDTRKKKEKRRNNERKQKEIIRMQMNMTTPTEIGLEQAGPTDEAMFALQTVDKSGFSNKIANGKMHVVTPKSLIEDRHASEEDSESDEEEDKLETQLDNMYEEFQERQSLIDPKSRAKKARKEHADAEFVDFSDREVSSDDNVVEDESSEGSSEDEEDIGNLPVFQKMAFDGDQNGALSRRAAMFFEQDIFKGIAGLEDVPHDDSGIEMEDGSDFDEPHLTKLDDDSQTKSATELTTGRVIEQQESDSEEAGFEIVQANPVEDDWDDDAVNEPTKNGRPDIDIITAEAMTLAHDIATGKRTKHDLLDDQFNKYTHRDVDGLPEWFLDDEDKHSKPQRPITAAGAAAVKEKLRALNARPIKKVREAKARKKFKAAQRLEKLKKKSALLIEDGDMSEKDKAQTIAKLMARATKKKPKKQVKVVVATGGNRGISGRPKGTKGKYKMVDARLKKDTRAEKRLAKKRK